MKIIYVVLPYLLASGLAAQTPPPAANAQMQAVLDALASLKPRPIPTLTRAQARRQPTPADAVMKVLMMQNRDTAAAVLVPGISSIDTMIPGAASRLPARIYRPEGTGPFPVIVYFHGGGWVIGNRMVYDGGARGIAKAANAIVVSVDYRLAPEHKFPAQHDDALAAYRWALGNAAAIGGDPRRVALAGESAGGNLAVATAIAARQASLQAPAHVLSVYPIAHSHMNTPSYTENANAKPLNKTMMGWFFRHTSRRATDLRDWRIDLVSADLTGLPPVTIVTAEIDPLRSEGRMLHNLLRAAGNDVQRRHYSDVTHEFFGMAAVVDEAKAAQQFAGDRLKLSFGTR